MKNIVIFKVHNSMLAVETEYIKKIIPEVTVTSIDGLDSRIAGVFAFEGKAVPVINLKKAFFKVQGDSAKMVVLKTVRYDREVLFAVSTDKIILTSDVDSANLAKKALINKHVPEAIIEEIYTINNITAIHINTDKLYNYVKNPQPMDENLLMLSGS